MADNEDQSSKTEEPTDRKLRKLREEGNLPKSKEVNSLFMLFGILMVVGVTMPVHMEKLGGFYISVLSSAGSSNMHGSAEMVSNALGETAYYAIKVMLPTFLVLIFFAWFGAFIQTGPVFSFKPIQPKSSKISLIKGFERLFSVKSLMEFLKSLLKLVLIGAGLFFVMRLYVPEFLQSLDHTVLSIVALTWKVAMWLVLVAIAIMLILAVIDWIFQKAQYTKENKMSLRELKDEFKDTEGDPHIKNRQRQLRQERAQKRMMANVPDADVVITNPTHYSVALSYKSDANQAAPVVVAKGVDHIAMRIREIAEEHKIPLYEDPPLARQLYKDVEVDDEIPLELYEVVAKVIAFIMKKDTPNT